MPKNMNMRPQPLKVWMPIVLLILFSIGCSNQRSQVPSVLVFTKTMVYEHASIPVGIQAIEALGAANNFEVVATADAQVFENDGLMGYSAVVFLSTTGNVLNHLQEAGLERYIQSGGGFVGIHAAADTEYDWRWYGQLVGAYFESHPKIQKATYQVVGDIPGTSLEKGTWVRQDEIYNYKLLQPDINVLVTVDENTYEGGTDGSDHPMSWYHDFDGGRSFYMGLGHTSESFTEDRFLSHLLGGIKYAIGDNLKPDFSTVASEIPPDPDRFSKVPLVMGEFFEPTEMALLPNGDVLIAQRRGEIMLYKARTKELKQAAYLDVYYKTLHTPDVNAEEGVMGLQKDPEFEANRWIYVFYSPTGDEWVNRLSRFKFIDDRLDLATEQVILDVASQREICCHTGGSIAFGPDNMLYLSTGDNSTPFNENGVPFVNNGFAPLNDLPGHEQYDAARSSGNTNDLRGKILRIKVNPDGSYDIPEGNLFPVGTPQTRPEIFTMGHRNPYRISVDPKKGWVYWGDVGPDARADSLSSRGPRGYDEMNQARAAGNFGWPFFIADNKAYYQYNYATGKSGQRFDPEKPVNMSRNNTGLEELPKAMPAYAFYPYVASSEFPQTGTGGRNAMAGPVYYADLYKNSTSLPDYYDEKVIVYDWMRGWMKAISLFESGEYNKMEPFAPDINVNNLIDMEIDANGKIYLLEYGSGWFTKNDDSGLSYIAFNPGNRPPVVTDLVIDRTSGKLPLTIQATVSAMDRDGDDIKYQWHFGDKVLETNEPSVSHTYKQSGQYKISVAVKDGKGGKTESNEISIVAGNSRPNVSIDLVSGNASFFIPGKRISYQVAVTDADEPELDVSNAYVSVDYMDGLDQASISAGHQQVSASVIGKSLTQAMDCKTCHKESGPSVGPMYTAVAQKYKGQSGALRYLQNKIISGGSGVWGEVTMPAHPDVSAQEARQIALYIQSLAEEKKPSLPASGSFVPTPATGDNVMVLTARYTDQGRQGLQPLTGVASITLRANTLFFDGETPSEGFQHFNFEGTELLIVPEETGWFLLEDIDLTGVKAVNLTAGWQDPPTSALQFELRLDEVNGELAGTGQLSAPYAPAGGLVSIRLNQPVDRKVDRLFIVFVPGQVSNANPTAILSTTFVF